MAVSRERLIYGGHTSCMAIHYDNELVIVDAGFGIANLAAELARTSPVSKGGLTYHIFLTHFHWDHIQGLSYFIPIYFKGNNIVIHSPFETKVVEEILNLLFDGSYSPFNGLDSLPCNWEFEQMKGQTELGSCKVSHHETVHIGETYSFRFDTPAGSIVTATDHDSAQSKTNDSFCEWAKGADLLVHSAMYTPNEYEQLGGFGHSSFIDALRNAENVGAAQTLLTHHSPLRKDSDLADFERNLQQMYDTPKRKLSFAREGVIYRIG